MTKREHLLVCLIEECGEVIQAASKALRFGLDDGYPGTGRTNVNDIARELDDLDAIQRMLINDGVDLHPDDSQILAKMQKVELYQKYAIERGTLEKQK
jgi:hypothetical protein